MWFRNEGIYIMIGEHLKSLRVKRKLSQRALAEKSGISNAEISRIESGERKKPSGEVLAALTIALEVDFDEFLKNPGHLYFPYQTNSSDLETYNEQCDSKFINIVTPKILKEGFNISLNKNNFLGNIIAIKDDYVWRIRFIPIHEKGGFEVNSFLMNTYGYLACYNELDISKFTIATNDEEVFKRFIKINPIKLDIVISIMLVNLEDNKIIDEYIFKK